MKSKLIGFAIVLPLSVLIINTWTTSMNLPLISVSEALTTPMLLWSYPTGGDILDVKSIPDVNGDGKPDVVAGSADNNVYVLDGSSGSKIWNKLTGGDVGSVDYVSDITGDGSPEIVCGSSDSKVYLLNGTDGKEIWPAQQIRRGVPVYKVLGVQDVTGDGVPDVFAGGTTVSYDVFQCFNGANGASHWFLEHAFSGYPYYNDDFDSLSDVTGDGKNDAVWTHWVYAKRMKLVNGATGSAAPERQDLPEDEGWVRIIAIPDVSGDGYEDIVNLRVDIGSSSGARALVLSGPSLEEIWRFEKSAVASDERMWDANYISDITSDGRPEIAVGWKNMVFMRNGITGLPIWNATLAAGNSAYSRSHTITEGRDISGDGVGDIVVGVENGDVYFLSGSNGSSILQTYRIGGGVLSVAYMDDVSGDSIAEVLVGGTDNFVYCLAPLEEPPHFESVDWTPANQPPFVYSSVAREGEPVHVEAVITDAGGVDRVMFAYRTNGGNWWNTSMNLSITTGRWTITIPGQPGSTAVEFVLQAFDNVGNRNSSETCQYTVQTLIVGDINGDGKVDVEDLYIFGKEYGKTNP